MTLVKHLWYAFLNSFRGLKVAFKREWAFRFEMLILVIAIPVALFIGHNAIERLLLVSSAVWLPIIELLNSAVEATVDRISTDYHELSGIAKDLATAAMFVTGLNVCVVWGFLIVRDLFFS